MRFLCLILFIATIPLSVLSQEVPSVCGNDSVTAVSMGAQNKGFELKDSLDLELVSPIMISTPSSFGMYGMTPFYNGYCCWELHEGFNASLGMHVTFSPSKYAPSGAGFGQNAAFMYAAPISNRLSIAAGVYATNFNWGFMDYKNVGLAFTAAFKVNNVVTLYGYGNKSIMPEKSPLYYPIPNFSPDKIGGMINFKIGESSSISFGVESVKGGYPYYW